MVIDVRQEQYYLHPLCVIITIPFPPIIADFVHFVIAFTIGLKS